jgi:CRISPR/Cas system CSM-associated protein Csm3 (group 7 of RAMP superfamily)
MIQLATLNQNPQTKLNALSLTAIIDTALCVGAGGSSGSLADKPIIRNASGNLVIPASQLKGRLRHECEKIARGLKLPVCQSPKAETMCPQRVGIEGNFAIDEYQIDNRHHCIICQIFGNPSLPSRILFEDLVCQEDPDNLPEVLRPGVTINRCHRTAEEKKLYLLETSPVNVQLSFRGNLYLLSDLPNYTQPLILAGLKHVHALGGSKSIGLGWLTWKLSDLSQTEWEFFEELFNKLTIK